MIIFLERNFHIYYLYFGIKKINRRKECLHNSQKYIHKNFNVINMMLAMLVIEKIILHKFEVNKLKKNNGMKIVIHIYCLIKCDVN
jgi:hypothetical protein